jgi:pyruvate formate lyase activating enzyme
VKEARFYEKQDSRVRCLLCPHLCSIAENGIGLCGVRQNMGGTLVSINYGCITAMHNDPVEKKPLCRFMPGTYTFSIGSFGCNLACPFCQNHEISKGHPRFAVYAPEDIVAAAINAGMPSVSYTYSEPVVFYEFMQDTAMLAHEKGLKNIMVTNGYINKEPLAELLPVIDAVNIDLKSFDDTIYRNQLKGSLPPVMDTIAAVRAKCHVEVTMLIVPGISDSLTDIDRAARALARIDENIPLHVSRYFPRYKYSEPETSLTTMQRAGEICKRYLKTVVLGNV